MISYYPSKPDNSARKVENVKEDHNGIYDLEVQEATDSAAARRPGERLRALGRRISAGARGAGTAVKGFRMPRFPKWLRIVLAWSIVIIAVAFIVGAGLELAASGKIAKGVSIDGAPVGGMTRARAKSVVEQKVKPITAPIQLCFEGKQYAIDLKAIGSKIDVDDMVQKAFEAGKGSPAALRVFRRVFGIRIKRDIPVEAACTKESLIGVVTTIARKVNREPTSASISLASGSPKIVPSRDGVKVKIEDTVKAVTKALPSENRSVNIAATMVTPEIVDSKISKIIWIRQKEFRLYLYNRTEEVNSYKVAVGMPQYPTPNGHFHVTYKERNPTWLPTSEWAKDKQGVPQPPGPNNPLGGYWMDIGGGIGIHATPFPNSLGSQASHGCIRMAESDAGELFNAINIGTPVFITD